MDPSQPLTGSTSTTKTIQMLSHAGKYIAHRYTYLISYRIQRQSALF